MISKKDNHRKERNAEILKALKFSGHNRANAINNYN